MLLETPRREREDRPRCTACRVMQVTLEAFAGGLILFSTALIAN